MARLCGSVFMCCCYPTVLCSYMQCNFYKHNQPTITFVLTVLLILKILCSVDCASRYNSCKWPAWCTILFSYMYILYRLRWSRGTVPAFGTQVRGFKPGRSRQIFKGEKILSTPSFRGEVKPSVPCRRFAACKRSLELRGSRILRQNLSEHFSPTKSSTFRC